MLIINDLGVDYGNKTVLNGVNLTCQPGEIHGILGVNGAGKTTLFNALYGFISKTGTCTLNKQLLKNQDVGFLETENYFYNYIKGYEYLQIVSGQRKRFEEWEAIFDLPLSDLVDTYSTGMRKKLALLGIILLDRPVIVLDEPFNGVDLESSERLFLIMERLSQRGKILLVASHILSTLTRACQYIHHLQGGIIEQSYAKEDFPALEKMLAASFQHKIARNLDDLMGN